MDYNPFTPFLGLGDILVAVWYWKRGDWLLTIVWILYGVATCLLGFAKTK